MISRSRLHIHTNTHKGPNGTAYIVGDRAGLLALAAALKEAATGVVGLETVTLYTSDGHPYNIVACGDVAEEEWQTAPPSYDRSSDPTKLQSIKLYQELIKSQDF